MQEETLSARTAVVIPAVQNCTPIRVVSGGYKCPPCSVRSRTYGGMTKEVIVRIPRQQTEDTHELAMSEKQQKSPDLVLPL